MPGGGIMPGGRIIMPGGGIEPGGIDPGNMGGGGKAPGRGGGITNPGGGCCGCMAPAPLRPRTQPEPAATT